MPHPLVLQLRFARGEFVRGLADIGAEDACRRVPPMNCVSWIVGHLASQEQRNWLTRMQGQTPLPWLEERFSYGAPASEPPVAEMWAAWQRVVALVDPWLDAQTTESLQAPMLSAGQPSASSVGTVVLRQIYHYWYHLGEGMALRQLLGHSDLPDFVGDIHLHAPFQPM